MAPGLRAAGGGIVDGARPRWLRYQRAAVSQPNRPLAVRIVVAAGVVAAEVVDAAVVLVADDRTAQEGFATKNVDCW